MEQSHSAVAILGEDHEDYCNKMENAKDNIVNQKTR